MKPKQLNLDSKVVGVLNNFLIVQSTTNYGYTIYNCKKGWDVRLPFINEEIRWTELKIEEIGIVLTATVPIPGKIKKDGTYSNKIQCFLNFITERVLEGSQSNTIFDSIEVIGDKICTIVTTAEGETITEWFDSNSKRIVRIGTRKDDKYFKVYDYEQKKYIFEKALQIECVKDLKTGNPVGLSVVYEIKEDKGMARVYFEF